MVQSLRIKTYKNKLKKSVLTLTFIFSLLHSISYPQETDSVSLDRLLEMPLSELADLKVVTASKTSRLASEITQKVDVITEKQKDQIISGNRNIAELIQYLPGASIKVLSRNDANWGAYGGIGPKYCTYMIQGLPVDGFVDNMSLDAMAIQRIEVQRGPASVLYPNYLSQDFAGNQSPLGGTVNIILKGQADKPHTTISAGYGSYKTYEGKAFTENSFGRLNMQGGISYEKSQYTNYGSPNSWLNILKNPSYQKGKVFAGASIYLDDPEKHMLSFFGNQTLHWGDFGRINRKYNNQYSLMNTEYTGQVSDNLRIALKAGLRLYDREWQNDTYDSASSAYILSETKGVKQFIVPVDFSLSINHFKNSNITFGIDYQNASYKTWKQPVLQGRTTGNDAQASQIGFYVQEELQLSKLTLRAGGRFNRISYDIDKIRGTIPGLTSQDWEVFIWSTGGKWRLTEKFILFTNIGNSFMSPGIKSIGGTIPLSDKLKEDKSGQLPNPDLAPEKGIGIDFGFDYMLPFKIYVSTRAFQTIITDAIIDNVISLNPSQTMSVNADGKTVGRGFELSLHQHIENKIDWFVNITYTNSEIDAPENQDQDGVKVPFVPEVTGNMGIALYLPFHIEICPSVHFGGRIYDSNSKSKRHFYDSRELFNLIIAKTFSVEKYKYLDVFIKLYNITDNKYQMPWEFQDPGFNVHFGGRIQF